MSSLVMNSDSRLRSSRKQFEKRGEAVQPDRKHRCSWKDGANGFAPWQGSDPRRTGTVNRVPRGLFDDPSLLVRQAEATNDSTHSSFVRGGGGLARKGRFALEAGVIPAGPASMGVPKKRASNQGRSGNPRQGAWETYLGRRPFRGAAIKALFSH